VQAVVERAGHENKWENALSLRNPSIELQRLEMVDVARVEIATPVVRCKLLISYVERLERLATFVEKCPFGNERH